MYPRRAHWPIVVPETPTSSPTSAARKRPWGRCGAMVQRVLRRGAEGKRASSARRAQELAPARLGDRRRAGRAQEVLEHRDEAQRVLAVREVPGVGEDLQPAPGNRGV